MPSTADVNNGPFDVLLLGETMLRFTPPGQQRLNQTQDFQIHVGGSESNTAVGLSRLGHRTSWLSRLPRSPLGETVTGELNRWGVDTSHVVWSTTDRLGLYFLENASAPRPSQVIYDRRDSAMSRMQPDDLPESIFASSRAKLFHATGITLAISDSARRTAMRAIELAKSHGMSISFDVNYRGKLWSPSEARAACTAAMRLAELIFIPERDARILFAFEDTVTRDQVIDHLAVEFPSSCIVMTCGREGSRAVFAGNHFSYGIYASSEIGRLGGGDSFAAGFLSKFLESGLTDITSCLQWGAATAAIKYSIAGDLPILTRTEVEQLIAAGQASEIVR